MASTLAERIKERMRELEITNAQLARMAGVQPPTSFNWASGKTKAIKGEPLLRAAQALKVTPGWLATGRMPKHAQEGAIDTKTMVDYNTQLSDNINAYRVHQEDLGEAAANIVRRLPPAVATEALAYLGWLASRYTPR